MFGLILFVDFFVATALPFFIALTLVLCNTKCYQLNIQRNIFIQLYTTLYPMVAIKFRHSVYSLYKDRRQHIT